MGMCFCESCRQQAGKSGIHVNEVVRGVRDVLEHFLHGKDNDSVVNKLRQGIAGLAEYESCQAGAVDALGVEQQSRANETIIDVRLAGRLRDAAEMVRDVSESVSARIPEVTFCHYGEMPLNRLAWVKQAVRKRTGNRSKEPDRQGSQVPHFLFLRVSRTP